MRSTILALFSVVLLTRCANDATRPLPTLAVPAPIRSAVEAAGDAPSGEEDAVRISVGAGGAVEHAGFPAISTDGTLVVSLEEHDDGLRGYPSLAFFVFDARLGGAKRQELPIVEIADTEARGPDDDVEDATQHRRVEDRLVAVHRLLRAKAWVPLLEGHDGVDLPFDARRWSIPATGTPGTESYCAFEPYEQATHVDPARRVVLLHVGYRAGPDWCNEEPAVELVVLGRS